jgi:hypothetical protein
MSETPIPSTIETVAAIMLGIPSIADQNAVRFMGAPILHELRTGCRDNGWDDAPARRQGTQGRANIVKCSPPWPPRRVLELSVSRQHRTAAQQH